MEHILKNEPNYQIKRYELATKSIWFIKKDEHYGLGATKKEAEINLGFKNDYATIQTPNWLYKLGSIEKSNPNVKIYTFPKLTNWVLMQLPLSWRGNYNFYVFYNPEKVSTCLMVINTSNLNTEPLYIYSDAGSMMEQLVFCVYQFYIEVDKGNWLKKESERNKKLFLWFIQWYNKIEKKGLKYD